jgi:hypothetical protein
MNTLGIWLHGGEYGEYKGHSASRPIQCLGEILWGYRSFRRRAAMCDFAEDQPTQTMTGAIDVDDKRCVVRGNRFAIPYLAIDLGPDECFKGAVTSR